MVNMTDVIFNMADVICCRHPDVILGVTHPVDSSELAFRTAMVNAVKQAFDKGKAKVS